MNMLANPMARNMAQELARTNPREALRVAKSIADPWYRVQALSWVARFAPDEIADAAFGEIPSTASATRDAYQSTAVLAWPLRAAFERGRMELATAFRDESAAGIAGIEQMASRAEAIGLLFAAAFPGGPALRGPILAACSGHCPPDGHWRSVRLYRSIAAMLAAENADAAADFARSMTAGKARDRCLIDLAVGKTEMARPFFW